MKVESQKKKKGNYFKFTEQEQQHGFFIYNKHSRCPTEQKRDLGNGSNELIHFIVSLLKQKN
jgi:hypothetical protein